jgi:heterodisulfide reductase subunit A
MVEKQVEGQKVQRAVVNPALCLGCGACVAVCPTNAINVQGSALKQYEAMVDMIVSDDYLEEA